LFLPVFVGGSTLNDDWEKKWNSARALAKQRICAKNIFHDLRRTAWIVAAEIRQSGGVGEIHHVTTELLRLADQRLARKHWILAAGGSCGYWPAHCALGN